MLISKLKIKILPKGLWNHQVWNQRSLAIRVIYKDVRFDRVWGCERITQRTTSEYHAARSKLAGKFYARGLRFRNPYIYNIVTYCPIKLGYVCTSVLAHGVMEVWRLVNVEYSKRDRDILSDFVLESEMFQPELHGYFLIELSHGKYQLYVNLWIWLIVSC